MYITNFKQDEFMRKSLEPFLKSRASTNLLNSMVLEESNRVAVCKVFIESLKAKGKEVISSLMHLDWAMECLGYAFSLPLSEISTIKAALRVYSDWLLVESSRPKIMESQLEYYRREILGHLSLVFYKKEDPVKQAEICLEVLNLYQKIIRYTEIENKTWLAMVQISILISDYILIYSPSLADHLSSKFLKLFFEVLLGAKTLDENLWVLVKKCIKTWIKNENLVHHWTSVNCGLSKSVISMVYLSNYNDIEIVFDHSHKSPDLIKVLLDDHIKLFYWYKFNDLLLDESFAKSQDPAIQAAISHSVHTIVDQLLTLCEQRSKVFNFKQVKQAKDVSHLKLSQVLNETFKAHTNYIEGRSRLPIPSIDSIMKIYGKWLLTHASVESSFDALGKSELISVLCRIFSVGQGPAKQEYLSNFFRVLLENLRNGDKTIVGEILKDSFQLISYGLETIKFFLYPNSFIHHVNIYLCDKESDPQIKFPCYMILAIISPICNKYQNKEFNKKIVDIYSQALGLETDDHNFWLVIWSMFTFAATIVDDQDSLQSILCIMIGRVESFDYKDKDKQKFSDMIEAISILPFVVKSKLVTSQIFKQIVSNLLAFVPKRTKKSDVERTTVLLLVLINWLDKFPEVFYDEEIKNEFFCKVNENSTYIDSGFTNMVIGFAINNLGRKFNRETGLNLSSYYKQSISNYNRRHFVISDSIISAFQNGEETGFVIRNPAGFYSWKVKKVCPEPLAQIDFYLTSITPYEPKQPTNEEISLKLEQDLDIKTKSLFTSFKKKFDYQKTVKRKNKEKFKSETEIKSNKFECNFHRSFLGQLGLIGTEGEVVFMNNEKFSKLISFFDSINEKELIQFPLVYLETPEDSETKAMTPKSYHKTFNNFIYALGSLITKESLMYSHFSNIINRFKKVVYCNMELFESIVIMPDIAVKHKKNWVLNDIISISNIIVIWNQRINDRYSNKIPDLIKSIDLNKFMIILLTSINDDLTKINILGTGKKSGPLTDMIVVPNEYLPKLLHLTIYSHVSTFKTRKNIWKHKLSIIKTEKEELAKQQKFSSSFFE